MSRLIAGLVVLVLALLGLGQAQAATTLFVALTGDDQWSGTLAARNPAKTDGPFATITRARDAIRELKASHGGLVEPVTVYLRGGTYFLSAPLTLTPEDSGTPECPITYAAYPGEKPVLSGGFPITDWSPVEVNGVAAWAAPAPVLADGGRYFHQLFVNGERRPRPRLPRKGLFRFAGLLVNPVDVAWNQGQDQAYFSDGDLHSWRNLSDVDVVALHFWVESRLPLVAVDEATHVATFARRSVFRLTDGQTTTPARFYVENVFEALDAPGLWYLDRPTATIYYVPQPGEDPRLLQIVAPRLSEVVRFDGDATNRRYVERISVSGLSFAHTEWNLPDDIAGYKQADFGVPAAVSLTAARNCALRDCEIAHVGTYAVEIGAGCRGSEIADCEMFDLGAGGVKLAQGSAATTLSNNRIHDGGCIFHSAVGILADDSGNNTITHNEIYNLYYTGISVGWRWGYRPSLAADNIVAWNHIHDIGRGLLSDLGGIYTLGVAPGTVVRNNLIHDITSATNRGRGIYLDEGSSDIVFESNLVYRVDDASFCINCGQDNVVRNNIFAFGKQAGIRRGRQENLRAFTFDHNIFYFAEGQLMAGAWGDGQYAFDYNLYYDARGLPVTFAGMSFDQWRQSGQDAHGMIADPQFANPAAGDFTLAATSPALAIGFRPIDLSQVGPR